MNYRELYELAEKAYSKDSRPGNMCDVHCFNAVRAELNDLDKLHRIFKEREERVEKLVKIKAPEIILHNEFRMLGVIEGMVREAERIGRLVSASEAVMECDVPDDYFTKVIMDLGREHCGDCAYCYDKGKKTKSGKWKPSNSCLCGSAAWVGLFGGHCEHFKMETEPFVFVRERQEGETIEERYIKAIAAVNERNKAEWEAEGCPDYSPENIVKD